jgi:hypothetical protein
VTSDADPPRPTLRVPYLAICAMYHNEAPNLKEWIEFHRLVGVERFFLYDNLSTDFHLDVLAPYIEDGTVVLHEWPVSPQGQVPAYEHCLREHVLDARWIAFIDIDEYLFSPVERNVAQLLVPYHPWPGLGVNSLAFGSSGHRARPGGLIIENYLQRSKDRRYNGARKLIAHARRVIGCGWNRPHHFHFRNGYAVDENCYPVNPYTKFCSHYTFRINHYWVKAGASRPGDEFEPMQALLNEYRDETILRYAPALRAAMGL